MNVPHAGEIEQVNVSQIRKEKYVFWNDEYFGQFCMVFIVSLAQLIQTFLEHFRLNYNILYIYILFSSSFGKGMWNRFPLLQFVI
jgi:hypothetical protein